MGRRRTSARISFFSFQDIITSVTGIMILVALLMGLELSQRRMAAPAAEATAIASDLRPAVEAAEREIRQLERRLASGGDKAKQLAAVDSDRLQASLADLRRQTPEMVNDVAALNAQLARARERLRQAQAKRDSSKTERDQADQLAKQLADAEGRTKKLRTTNRVIYNRPPNAAKTPWLVEVTAKQISAAPVGKSQRPVVFAAAGGDPIDAFCAWAKGRDSDSEYFLLIVKPDGIDAFFYLRDDLTKLGFELGFDVAAADQTVIDPETGAGI